MPRFRSRQLNCGARRRTIGSMLLSSARNTPLLCALALLPVLVVGCAGKDAEPAFEDPSMRGRDVNAEGLAYPTDHLGGKPRAGSQRGDRIPNFTFQGYRDSNRAGELQTISLADYYDPDQKRAKVLHMMEAATWCTICDGQTREMIATKDSLAAKGVIVLQALMNGARPGVGPTLLELDQWVDRYPTWFTVVVDERSKRVGSVADVGAVPWNALVDLRTMEIIFAGVGRPFVYEQFAQLGADWVKKNAPSY